MRPLAWGPPYAAGAALEKAKRQKKEKKKNQLNTFMYINSHDFLRYFVDMVKYRPFSYGIKYFYTLI